MSTDSKGCRGGKKERSRWEASSRGERTCKIRKTASSAKGKRRFKKGGGTSEKKKARYELKRPKEKHGNSMENCLSGAREGEQGGGKAKLRGICT